MYFPIKSSAATAKNVPRYPAWLDRSPMTWVKQEDTQSEIYGGNYRPFASPLQVQTTDATGGDIRPLLNKL